MPWAPTTLREVTNPEAVVGNHRSNVSFPPIAAMVTRRETSDGLVDPNTGMCQDRLGLALSPVGSGRRGYPLDRGSTLYRFVWQGLTSFRPDGC